MLYSGIERVERFATYEGNVTFMTRHEMSCKRNPQSASLGENIRISPYVIAVPEHDG